MSDVSLPTLPVELLHRIFDYLDIKSILLSIRFVCKNLYTITNNYNRFKLDFSSLNYSDIRLISRLIQLEYVIALIVSYRIDNQGQMRLFPSDFDLRRLERLNALTLCGVKEFDLVNCLQRMATSSLTSLTIDFKKCKKLKNETILLLSSFIAQSNLQKLHLEYNTYLSGWIVFSAQCSLYDLTISSCTCKEYVTVLNHCPCLRTFLIDHYIGFDGTILSSCSRLCHDQLNSLVIGDCQLSTEYIEVFLSLTPSLKHLEVISIRSEFDFIFDGHFWTRLIQNQLTALNHLEFIFKYHISSTDDFHNMSLIIAPFRNSFWLTDKHWFVTCDYVLSTSDIVLYTNSLGASDGEVLIRNEALSTDQVHILARPQSNNVNNSQEEQTLNLAHERIGDREMRHLADALEKNTAYTTLSLNFNQIGSLGAQHLANGLRLNTTLTALHLRNNRIGADGTQYLVDMLRTNNILAVLILCDNQIGALGACHIAGALKHNTTLTTLNLKSNQIGALGTQYLSDALQSNMNTRLTTLDLQFNDIGVLGAQHLANLLRTNKTLTTLNIGDNEIADLGTKFISEALHENKTLIKLNLYSNQIGPLGAQYLTTALQNNTTLSTLELEANRIGTSGAQHFADVLRKNTALKILDLRSNGIDAEGAHYLTEAIRDKETLIELKLPPSRTQDLSSTLQYDYFKNT